MKGTVRKIMRSRRHMWWAILGPTGVFVVIAAVVLGVAVVGVLGTPDPSTTSSSSCGGAGTPGSGVVVPVTGSAPNLTPEQLHNAQLIAGVALGLGLGRPGVLLGILTANVETDLRNLSGGDRDSVGLFQQRAPWSSFEDRHDPVTSATMFFQGGKGGQPGLLSVTGWETMDPGLAMQKVQQSQYSQQTGNQSPGYPGKLAAAAATTDVLMAGQPAAAATTGPGPARATAAAGGVVPLPVAPVAGAGCPAVLAAAAAHPSVPAGSFVSYTQWDPTSAWHSLPYWGSTIGNAGCGPTSVAEVVATWKDKSITPDKVASYITSIGGEGQGDLYPSIFQHYGLKAVGLSTMDQAVAGLKTGGIVIISASGSSPFTSEGHFVVLRAINPDGRIELGDVNAPMGERTNAHSWSPAELLGATDSTGIHSLNLVTKAAPVPA